LVPLFDLKFLIEFAASDMIALATPLPLGGVSMFTPAMGGQDCNGRPRLLGGQDCWEAKTVGRPRLLGGQDCWEAKTVGLAVILVDAFFQFAWAYRRGQAKRHAN
jgi:hypothetical protein